MPLRRRGTSLHSTALGLHYPWAPAEATLDWGLLVWATLLLFTVRKTGMWAPCKTSYMHTLSHQSPSLPPTMGLGGTLPRGNSWSWNSWRACGSSTSRTHLDLPSTDSTVLDKRVGYYFIGMWRDEKILDEFNKWDTKNEILMDVNVTSILVKYSNILKNQILKSRYSISHF